MFGLDLLTRLGGRKSRRRVPVWPRQGDGAVVMKPVSVLVLVQVLGSVSSQPEQHCPPPCECSESDKTVKCVNRSLSEVPRDLPAYVRTLLVTGNNITRLSQDTAPLAALTDLATLDLSANRLQEVEPGSLADLPGLRRLDLSDNRISRFSSLSFGAGSPLAALQLNRAVHNESVLTSVLRSGALSSLSSLELSGNRFLYLPQGLFAALPNLVHLSLRDNYLVGLPAGLFVNLTQLRTLDLSDNSLRRLRNGTLRDLPRGVLLNLASNAWRCDCELEEFVSWLKETPMVPGKEQLLCTDPQDMRNVSLVGINISDLKCSDSDDLSSLQTSYVFLGIVLALIGLIFLLVLYLNRKGIKKWIYNIRDACRDHMEGYHYRYEINADPRLTNLSSSLDV
ncbi:trophoblast glycoprotein [Lissotriton helveticus]